MEYFFAALRYLKKKLKGNAESKDRDLLNFLRRYGDGFHLLNIKMKLRNSIYLTMSIFVTNLEEQRCIGYMQTYV